MKSDIFLSFAAGFIAGTAVAYLLITDRLQRKMDQEIEERVDEVEKSAFEEYRENVEYITKMHEKKEEKKPIEYTPNNGMSDIEILDPDTFHTGALGYEFFEVDCYVNSGVIADDDGNKFPQSAEELIGKEAMVSGGAYGADPHDVYVRNHKYRMDLHVHLLDIDYVEDVDIE